MSASRVRRDGVVIRFGIPIGQVFKDGKGWAYKVALRDRSSVGSFSRRSDAVDALVSAWRER